jgi:hypothetical protein
MTHYQQKENLNLAADIDLGPIRYFKEKQRKLKHCLVTTLEYIPSDIYLLF